MKRSKRSPKRSRDNSSPGRARCRTAQDSQSTRRSRSRSGSAKGRRTLGYLGQKLCDTPLRLDFDLSTKTDSLSGYDPLRDPALLEFLSKPDTLRRLVRLGLVTQDGRVVTSCKKVSEYCDNYLHDLKATLAHKKMENDDLDRGARAQQRKYYQLALLQEEYRQRADKYKVSMHAKRLEAQKARRNYLESLRKYDALTDKCEKRKQEVEIRKTRKLHKETERYLSPIPEKRPDFDPGPFEVKEKRKRWSPDDFSPDAKPWKRTTHNDAALLLKYDRLLENKSKARPRRKSKTHTGKKPKDTPDERMANLIRKLSEISDRYKVYSDESRTCERVLKSRHKRLADARGKKDAQRPVNLVINNYINKPKKSQQRSKGKVNESEPDSEFLGTLTFDDRSTFKSTEATTELELESDTQFYTAHQDRLSLSPKKKPESKESPQRAKSLPASYLLPPQEMETVEEKVERARSREKDSLEKLNQEEPKQVQSEGLRSLGYTSTQRETTISDASLPRLGSNPLFEITKMLSEITGSLHRIESNKDLKSEEDEPEVESEPLAEVKGAQPQQKTDDEPVSRLYRVVAQLFQLFSLKLTRSTSEVTQKESGKRSQASAWSSRDTVVGVASEVEGTQAQAAGTKSDLRHVLQRITSDVISSSSSEKEAPTHETTRDHLHKIMQALKSENIHLQESEILLDVMQCLMDQLTSLSEQEKSEQNPQEQKAAQEKSAEPVLEVSKSLHDALHTVADKLTNMVTRMQSEQGRTSQKVVEPAPSSETETKISDQPSAEKASECPSGWSAGNLAWPEPYATSSSQVSQKPATQVDVNNQTTRIELSEKQRSATSHETSGQSIVQRSTANSRDSSAITRPQIEITSGSSTYHTAAEHEDREPTPKPAPRNSKNQQAKLNRLGELFEIVSEIKLECLGLIEMKVSTRDVETTTGDIEETLKLPSGRNSRRNESSSTETYLPEKEQGVRKTDSAEETQSASDFGASVQATCGSEIRELPSVQERPSRSNDSMSELSQDATFEDSKGKMSARSDIPASVYSEPAKKTAGKEKAEVASVSLPAVPRRSRPKHVEKQVRRKSSSGENIANKSVDKVSQVKKFLLGKKNNSSVREASRDSSDQDASLPAAKTGHAMCQMTTLSPGIENLECDRHTNSIPHSSENVQATTPGESSPEQNAAREDEPSPVEDEQSDETPTNGPPQSQEVGVATSGNLPSIVPETSQGEERGQEAPALQAHESVNEVGRTGQETPPDNQPEPLQRPSWEEPDQINQNSNKVDGKCSEGVSSIQIQSTLSNLQKRMISDLLFELADQRSGEKITNADLISLKHSVSEMSAEGLGAAVSRVVSSLQTSPDTRDTDRCKESGVKYVRSYPTAAAQNTAKNNNKHARETADDEARQNLERILSGVLNPGESSSGGVSSHSSEIIQELLSRILTPVSSEILENLLQELMKQQNSNSDDSPSTETLISRDTSSVIQRLVSRILTPVCSENLEAIVQNIVEQCAASDGSSGSSALSSRTIQAMLSMSAASSDSSSWK